MLQKNSMHAMKTTMDHVRSLVYCHVAGYVLVPRARPNQNLLKEICCTMQRLVDTVRGLEVDFHLHVLRHNSCLHVYSPGLQQARVAMPFAMPSEVLGCPHVADQSHLGKNFDWVCLREQNN